MNVRPLRYIRVQWSLLSLFRHPKVKNVSDTKRLKSLKISGLIEFENAGTVQPVSPGSAPLGSRVTTHVAEVHTFSEGQKAIILIAGGHLCCLTWKICNWIQRLDQPVTGL
jgi:hypothetical protein